MIAQHIRGLATTALAILATGGCSSDIQSPPVAAAPVDTVTMLVLTNTAQLRQRLPLSTDTNIVLSVIGRPSWLIDEYAGNIVWKYHIRPFPADDDMPGTYVIAATLTFTNGRLAHIGYTYADPPAIAFREEKVLAVNAEGGASSVLEVFLARSTPEQGDVPVHSEGRDDVWYIPTHPALVVHRFLDLGTQESTVLMPDGSGRRKFSFTFELRPDDAKAFASLTRDNLGKRMVMMTSNTIVANVLIVEPLESGRVSMSVAEEARIPVIKALLARIPHGDGD